MPLRGAVVQSAERAAKWIWLRARLRNRVRQNRRVGQDHPAQADDVGPALAHDVLGDMRQILLQIAVTGADEDETLWRSRFDWRTTLILPRHTPPAGLRAA